MTVREYVENNMPVNPDEVSKFSFIIKNISNDKSKVPLPSPLKFTGLKEVTTFNSINEFESILQSEIINISSRCNIPMLLIKFPQATTVTTKVFSDLIKSYMTVTDYKSIEDIIIFMDVYHDYYFRE